MNEVPSFHQPALFPHHAERLPDDSPFTPRSVYPMTDVEPDATAAEEAYVPEAPEDEFHNDSEGVM